MNAPEDSTRPLSVAELLARNGTIGSPPVGGRRRRRGRRNSDGVSVAELTGEIPVIRTGEIPVVDDADYVADEEYSEQEAVYEEFGSQEVTPEEVIPEEVTPEEVTPEAVTYREYAASAEGDPAAESSETVILYASAEEPQASVFEAAVEPEAVAEYAEYTEEDVEVVSEAVAHAPLPRSDDPLPHRSDRPERGHDPRPVRRSSGAEQMAYDPVDESVSLADLVDDGDAEHLRTYLQASQDTLFSGGTVADDLARRGVSAEPDDAGYDADDHADEDDRAVSMAASPAAPRRVGNTAWNSAVAVLQSLLAVVFGAGLFIGFDQLWRWNHLVALILSVLVVLTLAAVVRIVRKTEDIVSTLTAVAVGLLVTLGPLALQSN